MREVHDPPGPVVPGRRTFLGGVTAGVAALGLPALPAAAAADGGGQATSVLVDRMARAEAWRAYMRAQDMVWSEVPDGFYQAPFLGNGGLGVALFRDTGSKRLKIEVGDTRVRDHQRNGDVRFGTARLRVGYFLVETEGDVIEADLRLSLWDAELSGTIVTTRGTLAVSAFVHATRDLLVCSLTPAGGERAAGFRFTPYPAESTVLQHQNGPGNLRKNPPPDLAQTAEGGLCDQPLDAGGGHATAWRVVAGDGGVRHLVAGVASAFPEPTAPGTAAETVAQAARQPVPRLRGEHRRWWHDFYPKSFVSVPDARLQSFYWIQLYKMACITRRDRPVSTTAAQWLEVTPWPAAWWNLNIQLTYWFLNPTNHPELDSLTRSLDECRDALTDNVPAGYRSDSAAINRASQEDLVTSPVGIPGQGTPEVGNLTWALHNVWLTYRHTMDDALLRDVLYPLLRRAVNYYLHFLYEGPEGRLHLPTTMSPEYGGAKDCNYDLALLYWGCQTLVEATERLRTDDELLPKWRDVLDRLTAPPQGAEGMWIGSDLRLTSSHRHYSHLLWFYPLYLLDPGVPENRRLLERSLSHWVGFTGALQGYTFTGAASMSASLGKGDDALDYLNTLLDKFVQPNTMYRESGPVLETPLSGAQSMHDMLLQSWGGTVRIFPAVPDAWQDAQIHNLRTEGAFLVSARRSGGTTRYVRVRSLAGEPLKLAHGLSGEIDVHRVRVVPGRAAPVERPVAWRDLGDGVIALDLDKDDDVIVAPAGSSGHTVEPAAVSVPAKPWGFASVLPRPEGEVVPVDLAAAYDNDGIATAAAPADGNFDGSGYTYPAAELPAAGPFRHGGVTFAFPGSGDGEKNNVAAGGTRIDVPRGAYRRLRVLGACSGGDLTSALVATYADGTTGTVRLPLTDWGRQPAYGEAVAVQTTHRLGAAGPHTLQVRIFHQLADVDPARELVSLTLPAQSRPALHLFALSLEKPSA
ncbi:glycoside hydrolase family 95-like protein [Streptomyces sp. NPDC004134]|uniref:glycosyl hydrolase family 95 catalytic domain-containing protein n=1 Tax=Streptomyces sp. NPDC004134 TaxID=3364691 RepID=UPI0036CD497A